jgi:hypothetical protein
MPPRGSPMKFTTFHQHHQLVAHPQHIPTNGNYNGNYQTVQINTNQQHYMIPQSHHHHQQQQQNVHQQYQMPTNYVTNNVFKMNQSPPSQVPFVPQQPQQQRSSAIWHQQYTTSTPLRNDFNGNSSESG